MGDRASKEVKAVPSGSFSDLPAEVLSMIVTYCPIKTCVALRITCRQFRRHITIPEEYRKVDISVHTPWPQISNSTFTGKGWPKTFDLSLVAVKQQAFMREISVTPTLGRLVHDLTWTIRNRYFDAAAEARGERDFDECLWHVFGTMSNVTTLDLCCLQDTWDWDYLRKPPEILFPSVTRLRLSGTMYRQIAETVVRSINLERLEELSFDNLQDPGYYRSIYPYCRTNRPEKRFDTPRDQLYDWESDEIALSGPMRGILPCMKDQCKNLRSFHYRRPGRMYIDAMLNPFKDEECYVEVAEFTKSVSGTLVKMEFEQGVNSYAISDFQSGRAEYSHPMGARAHLRMFARPMDKHVRDHLIPSILQVEWPALQSLRITGMTAWMGRPGVGIAQRKELARHLDTCVKVSLEGVPDRPCSELHGMYEPLVARKHTDSRGKDSYGAVGQYRFHGQSCEGF